MAAPSQKPKWQLDAEAASKARGERMRARLTDQEKALQLKGIRVLVLRNEKTGAITPLTVIHGKDHKDYDSLVKAVDKVHAENEHRPGFILEDRVALSLEDFERNNPELLVDKRR